MVWRWSKISASNSSADSTINWAEGQAPSSINDSARAEMARVAQWRDDITGAIVTGGTSTAYTVSSNQVFDTLAHLDGAMIAFSPHITNGATVTLNVDGIGAKPLRSAPSTELLAGVLVQGTPYVAVYNNSDGAFYLQALFGNPYNVPLASGLDYWGTSAPNSAFAFPYGQTISRTTYAGLFALIGTTYGTGDGSTTFNLPDKRGRVSAGLDNMGGSSASRLSFSLGTGNVVLGAATSLDYEYLTIGMLPAHNHAVYLNDPGHSHLYGPPNLADVGGSTTVNFWSGNGNNGRFNTNTATTGMTISSAPSGAGQPNATELTGSGAAHSTAQPTILCNYIIRIL